MNCLSLVFRIHVSNEFTERMIATEFTEAKEKATELNFFCEPW